MNGGSRAEMQDCEFGGSVHVVSLEKGFVGMVKYFGEVCSVIVHLVGLGIANQLSLVNLSCI